VETDERARCLDEEVSMVVGGEWSLSLAGIGAALAVGVAACSSGPMTAAATSTTPPSTRPALLETTPAPSQAPTFSGDRLVSVSNGQLHVRCVGNGTPTVLLIAGFGEGLTRWANIEQATSGSARVCSYDRFGDGTSSAPPAPQTFQTEARDLRQSLRVVDVTGPFVVVGHSLGGTEAVTFASLFRSEVSGLLLIDASPPNWGDAQCSIKSDGIAGAKQWTDACAYFRDPAKNSEGLDGARAYEEAKKIAALGALPLVADTAVNDDYAATGLGAADVAALKAAWLTGQAHWLSLSSDSRLVPIASGHHIYLDHPDLVVRQISQLLRGSTAA
jgi:pimeloyl-ACP methyl ester carboxylesterase